ncbi:MAG: metallophosphoesterase [Chloroflexi bacterium]|nr:MAG: metallophosphoesterase [Chloroflexota bacterium]
MKLYAISDLHLNHKTNWQTLLNLPQYPEDWLIIAGDVADTIVQFAQAMVVLSERFAKVFWTPGNHDLWTLPTDKLSKQGVHKYNQLIAICRKCGVLTPEDDFVQWAGEGQAYWIAPTFTLYDYSFRPDTVSFANALTWARETNVECTDEIVLHSYPFASKAEWCAARCQYTENRLQAIKGDVPIILINHFPLRYDLVNLRMIPRFSLWCGTKLTELWHSQFQLDTVIYGHLHIRGTYQRDQTQFMEVSQGYPQNWDTKRGTAAYLRQILPKPISNRIET